MKQILNQVILAEKNDKSYREIKESFENLLIRGKHSKVCYIT